MATTTAASPSKSPFEVMIDRVWRFFCSVRWAVAEIAFLALLVLIGTLRGSEVPEWIADAVPFTRGIVDVWYDWDVYRSPLFAATLTVIAIAIAVCTLNRAPGIWQAISNPTITTTRGFLRSADTSAQFDLANRDRERTTSELGEALKAKRYRVITRTVGEQTHLYADKNRYAKLGTFPFHLALILLLLGGIVASRYGFRDQEFVVAEGDTRAVGHGTGLSIKLNSFIDSYTPGSVASSYESDIVVYKDGEEVESGIINPNDPMSFGTATIYQSSFIYAAVVTVRDPYGGVIWSGPIDIGVWHFKGNEDAPAGYRDIPEAGIRVSVVGQDVNPANAPELDTLNLQSGEMWIQVQPLTTVNTSELAENPTYPSAVVAQNASANLGNVDVTFERESRATVLQIANNPGIPIFIIASLMMVGGLVVVFYFPQRRIRGLVWNGPEGVQAHLAPLARRDWSGKREFVQAMRDAEERLSVRAVIKQPAGTEGSPDDALQPVPTG
jgi:cytochrome c biogenesis protein